MNKNINNLPTKIVWESLKDAMARFNKSYYYDECLVVTHKHSKKDWEIVRAAINPIDSYKKYEIKDLTYGGIIDKKDVLKIAFIKDYGYIE